MLRWHVNSAVATIGDIVGARYVGNQARESDDVAATIKEKGQAARRSPTRRNRTPECWQLNELEKFVKITPLAASEYIVQPPKGHQSRAGFESTDKIAKACIH